MINLVSPLQRKLSAALSYLALFHASQLKQSDLQILHLQLSTKTMDYNALPLFQVLILINMSSSSKFGAFWRRPSFSPRKSCTDFRLPRFQSGIQGPQGMDGLYIIYNVRSHISMDDLGLPPFMENPQVGFTKKGHLPFKQLVNVARLEPPADHGAPSGSLRGAGGEGHLCGRGWGALEGISFVPAGKTAKMG